MKYLKWWMPYSLMALIGIGLAYFLSFSVFSKAYSQQQPAVPAAPSASTEPAQQPQQAPPAAPPVAQQPPASSNNPAAAVDDKKTPYFDGATAVPESNAKPLQMGDFVYDPTGKRDPFKPYRSLMKADIKDNKPVEITDPLQRWDIDKFKVVAVLWNVTNPRAMIRDPDGRLFSIAKNTRVGRNNGYVSQIREGEILIVESIIGEEGATRKEVRILELSK
ncbi:MAG: pilus assembly protein PilP [Pseudobdellovibrionaceae bacterium]